MAVLEQVTTPSSPKPIPPEAIGASSISSDNPEKIPEEAPHRNHPAYLIAQALVDESKVTPPRALLENWTEATGWSNVNAV